MVGKHDLKSQVGLVYPGFQAKHGWQTLPGKHSHVKYSQLDSSGQNEESDGV